MACPEFTATSYPIRLYLARNRRDWNALMKKWRKNWFYPAVATNASFTQITAGVYVLAIAPTFKKSSPAEQAGALAHEATHAWQHIAEYIGERREAWESEAYTVQAIVEWAYKIVVDGAVN